MSEPLQSHSGGRACAPRPGCRLAGPWPVGAFLIAAAAVLPICVLFSSVFFPQADVIEHLVDVVLLELLGNTAALLAGVVPLTLVLGVGLGWLTGACEYPGRRFFAWSLVLPFALPPYVFAFVYLGLLDFTGPVQTALREVFPGMGFVDVRGAPGVAFILSLAFYPYVYLLSRSAFLSQGRTGMEAARSLGCSPRRAFLRVALPMARPWIAAGTMLVVMETLADFGAVAIFNYDTFTTAIYKAWFGMFSLESAAQLSSILVFFVLLVLFAEQRLRSRARYTQAGRHSGEGHRLVLRGVWKWLAFGTSLGVFVLAFALPCAQLVAWAWPDISTHLVRFAPLVMNTLSLGLGAATLACGAAVVLAFARRTAPGAVMNWTTRLATLGYAVPGTVLAVGVVIPLSGLDAWLVGAASGLGLEVDPLLQGSLAALLAGYVIRFLTAGYGSVDSSMRRITPSMMEASLSLGVGGGAMLRRVFLPLLRGGVLTGAVLVLVDVMKEMPLTLMLRPFGWDTLAVKIFELTSEGEWERAAFPAILLVLAGIVPVLMLTGKLDNQES